MWCREMEVTKSMGDLPTRCIDPVMKYCQNCRYGHNIYPDWVETKEDLIDCCFETQCTLGFDKGRPEDEPTEEELKDFEEWCDMVYKSKKEVNDNNACRLSY